jgi:HD-GYP domain-containing protein (c-di-GMP phosphodiesterase class II)
LALVMEGDPGLSVPILLFAASPDRTGAPMPAMPVTARLYVVAVLAAACACIAVAATRTPHDRLDEVLILAALYVVSGSLCARGSRDMLSISLESVTALAAIPLVGMWGAILVAWTAAFAVDPQSKEVVKRLFNGAQLALSAGAAGLAYHLCGGTIGLNSDSFPKVLVAILVADLVHCAVNGALVAVVVGLVEKVSPVVVFQGTMARSVTSYLGYGLFGVLLAVLWDGAGVGPAAALLLLLPLFVARWAYAQYAEQQHAYDRTVKTLVAAVETKDLYTRGHSERVAAASVLIARVIGMREDRVASLRYAGMLHDIGKLGVPTRVLQKTTRLTDSEFAAVQLHPVRGFEMVREIEFLGEAFAGIMHHHERLDGLGYPMGLIGMEIPEFARVIAVADAFDSMTTTRSYRGARTREDALRELERCAGSQFDPAMVEALVSALAEHGWEPETTPLFERVASDGAEPPPTASRTFDHDDPALAETHPAVGEWSS